MTVRDVRGLTIGEFGRRSGLTNKALRLYDVSGLLLPAQVEVAEAGLTRTGPVREIYLAHWDTIAGTDPFVRVAQPVADALADQ
jgi:hypothetical protein